MRNVTRRAMTVLVAATLGLGLAACESDDGGDDDGTTESETGGATEEDTGAATEEDTGTE